jgi:hypothetical protein
MRYDHPALRPRSINNGPAVTRTACVIRGALPCIAPGTDHHQNQAREIIIMKRLVTILAAVAMTQMFAGLALAAEGQPTATLALSQGQVGVGIGFSWGAGTLNFHGKNYTVKVDGLSVGDVGITKAVADGKIYNLNHLEDFNGTYVSVAAEGTVGLGAGAKAMKNEHGVVIHLYPVTKGISVKLAGEGVKLRLLEE